MVGDEVVLSSGVHLSVCCGSWWLDWDEVEVCEHAWIFSQEPRPIHRGFDVVTNLGLTREIK